MITKTLQKKFISLKKKNFKKPDKKQPHVYLAGAMQYVKDFGTGWRTKMVKELEKNNITVFSPANEQKIFKEEKRLKEITDKKFQVEKVKGMFHEIIMIDLDEVLKSDLILCKWNNDVFSCGTSGELTVAKLFNIPIIMIVDEIERVPLWALGCVSHHQKSFRNISNIINSVLTLHQSK